MLIEKSKTSVCFPKRLSRHGLSGEATDLKIQPRAGSVWPLYSSSVYAEAVSAEATPQNQSLRCFGRE